MEDKAKCQNCSIEDAFLFCIHQSCIGKRRWCFDCQHNLHTQPSLLNINKRSDFDPFRSHHSQIQTKYIQMQVETSKNILRKIQEKAIEALKELSNWLQKQILITIDFFTYIYESSTQNYFKNLIRSTTASNQKLDNVARFMKAFPESSFKSLQGARVFFKTVEYELEKFSKYISENTKQLSQDIKSKIQNIFTKRPSEMSQQVYEKYDQTTVYLTILPAQEQAQLTVPKKATISELVKKLEIDKKIPAQIDHKNLRFMNQSQYALLANWHLNLQTKIQNIAIGKINLAIMIRNPLSVSSTQTNMQASNTEIKESTTQMVNEEKQEKN